MAGDGYYYYYKRKKPLYPSLPIDEEKKEKEEKLDLDLEFRKLTAANRKLEQVNEE